MTRYVLSLILVLLSFSSCRQANKDKDKQRIDSVCDKFMELYLKGRISESLLLIKQNSNAIPLTEIDSLDIKIKKTIASLAPAYGKMVSFDFITEHKVKDYLAKRFYILKYERYFQTFDFTLYKGSSKWTIISFNFNDELLELMY